MALPSLDEFLQPLSPDSPAGENLRYDPLTDQIKEARRREDDVNQGVWKRAIKEPDYKLTAKLCRDALTKRSKDLQIAAWYTEALVAQEGIPGLLFGLSLIRGLLEQFWETVYPEIEDGDLELRATPLQWIGSQLDRVIKSIPLTRSGLDWAAYAESKTVPSEERANSDSQEQELRQDAIELGKTTPEEFEKAFSETPYDFYKQLSVQVTTAVESIQNLSTFCDEKFGNEAPSLGDLTNTIEDVQKAVRVLLIRKQEIEGISPDTKDDSGPSSESDFGGAEEAQEATEEIVQDAAPKRRRGGVAAEPEDEADAISRVLSSARFLRRQNPSNPAPYLLTRGLRWGELRAGGPQPEPFLFEAPPTQIRVDLKRLFLEGQYDQALETAEEAMGMPCGRAWLDLHRYSVRCAQYLGYDLLCAALKDELKALLQAYPSLPDFTLADDTPCANGETQAWLKEENLIPGEAKPEAETPSFWTPPPAEPEMNNEELSTREAPPPDVEQIALEAARNGRIQDAVAMLWREVSQETSGRGKFVRRSQLARICLSTGHSAIATRVLRELTDEISERRLEEWEDPQLITAVLGMLYGALDGDEDSAELRRTLYERICHLDPMRALEMGDLR